MKDSVKLVIAICIAVICTSCTGRQTVAQKLDAYFNAVDGHFMGSVYVATGGMAPPVTMATFPLNGSHIFIYMTFWPSFYKYKQLMVNFDFGSSCDSS